MLQAGPHSYAEQGKGPPLVCLHGIGGDDRGFAAQLASLSDTFRVIAWNMPGYRNSTPLPAFIFSALADALADFLNRLNLPRATLIGHSIGGMVAQEAALTMPDRVDRLVLIGTTPAFGGRDPSFAQSFLKARLAPLDAGQTMAQMAAEAAPHLTGPTASAKTRAAVAQTIADTPETVWRDILTCLTTFNRHDDLHRITRPCLLISGGHDANAPAKTMARMAASLPDAQHLTIETAGHMIQIEAPGQVNTAIRNFLTKAAP